MWLFPLSAAIWARQCDVDLGTQVLDVILGVVFNCKSALEFKSLGFGLQLERALTGCRSGGCEMDRIGLLFIMKISDTLY